MGVLNAKLRSFLCMMRRSIRPLRPVRAPLRPATARGLVGAPNLPRGARAPPGPVWVGCAGRLAASGRQYGRRAQGFPIARRQRLGGWAFVNERR